MQIFWLGVMLIASLRVSKRLLVSSQRGRCFFFSYSLLPGLLLAWLFFAWLGGRLLNQLDIGVYM